MGEIDQRITWKYEDRDGGYFAAHGPLLTVRHPTGYIAIAVDPSAPCPHVDVEYEDTCDACARAHIKAMVDDLAAVARTGALRESF